MSWYWAFGIQIAEWAKEAHRIWRCDAGNGLLSCSLVSHLLLHLKHRHLITQQDFCKNVVSGHFQGDSRDCQVWARSYIEYPPEGPRPPPPEELLEMARELSRKRNNNP